MPKEDIYKLFANKEDVFLFWNGRKEDTTDITLPFQSIEQIDKLIKDVGSKIGLFDVKGKQLKGWMNKLIWGATKQD